MKRVFLFLLICWGLIEGISAQNRWYVDVNGSSTGAATSWATACSDLQLVINNTSVGDTIWVAQGIYLPIRPIDKLNIIDSNNRDNAFVLSKDIFVYGGFCGTETDISQRNWKSYVTILDGDIGIPNNTSDNVYHVVMTYQCSAVLDGFTISGGNATGNNNFAFYGYSVPRGDGGGMYNVKNYSLKLYNLIIKNNAANWGGGMYNEISTTNLYNVSIWNNTANDNGGGLLSRGSNLLIVNSLFHDNTARLSGGAIYSYPGGWGGYANPQCHLVNATISKNTAPTAGAIYHSSPDPIHIHNSIIYGNSSGLVLSSTFNHTYSLIQGMITTANGNIDGDTDPLFENPNNGDFRLQQNSPCLNIGNNAYFQSGGSPDISSITTDLDNNPRIANGIIDMGAYEYKCQKIIINDIIPDVGGVVYVNKHITGGTGSGNSWTNATKELADALYAAKTNTNIQQIWVAQGTYHPLYIAADDICDVSLTDRDKSFVMVKNVQIYGGFTGTETNISQRDWNTNLTILSGDIGAKGDSSDNCYHVIISAGDNTEAGYLDGFTITNGNANAQNSIIVNGQTVSKNSGGGIYNSSSSPVLTNITLDKNTAISGGGMFNYYSSPELTNVNISKNRAGNDGGGLLNDYSFPVLTNITIADNYATQRHGGISNSSSSSNIRNSIIWGNTSGTNVIDNVESQYNLFFNCLVGGAPIGNGIILNEDPLFVNPMNDDYRLSPCSPAIEVGNNDFYSLDSLPNLSNIITDLDNNPRFYNNGIIDLGAYEYQGIFQQPPSASIGDDTVICSGESANIIFNITGTPNWDIVYTKDNGVSFDTLKNITTSPYILTNNHTTTTTYKLQNITNHICSGVPLSDEITITVLEPALDNILSTDTLCDGQQTTPIDFTGTATQINWMASGAVQGLPTGTQTGSFGAYKLENKTSALLTSTITITPIHTQGGITCTGSTYSFDIIVAPSVSIQSITSNETAFCEGEMLDMEVSTSGYFLSYQWFKDGTAISGATNKRHIASELTMNHQGNYYVEVYSACGQERSESIAINVSIDNALVEKWHDVILVDNSSEQYFAYQWYRDGIMIQGATNQFYQELGGLKGCYKVELTLESGSKKMTCERCLDKVGKSLLLIYPKPAKQGDLIKILLNDEHQNYQGIMEIKLYATDGKLLKTERSNSGNIEINTSHLATGIYILKIKTEDGQSYNEKIEVY